MLKTPQYYSSKPIPAAQEILLDLGFNREHLEMECRSAWGDLGWNYFAPLTHACKYLWRVGKKGTEADAIADWGKVRHWLAIALEEYDDAIYALDLIPIAKLPSENQILDAIAKVDVNLG